MAAKKRTALNDPNKALEFTLYVLDHPELWPLISAGTKLERIERWLKRPNFKDARFLATLDEVYRLVKARNESPHVEAAMCFLDALEIAAPSGRGTDDGMRRAVIRVTMITGGAQKYAQRLTIPNAARASAAWARKGRAKKGTDPRGKWTVLSEVLSSMGITLAPRTLKDAWETHRKEQEKARGK